MCDAKTDVVVCLANPAKVERLQPVLSSLISGSLNKSEIDNVLQKNANERLTVNAACRRGQNIQLMTVKSKDGSFTTQDGESDAEMDELPDSERERRLVFCNRCASLSYYPA